MRGRQVQRMINSTSAIKTRAEAALQCAMADIYDGKDASVNYETAMELFRAYCDKSIANARIIASGELS